MSGALAFAYGMHGEFAKAREAAAHGILLGARRSSTLPTQAACLFFCGVVRGWHGELVAGGVGVRGRADPLRACRRHLPPVPDLRLARPGVPSGRPPRRGRGRPQALPRARRQDRDDLPSRRLPGLPGEAPFAPRAMSATRSGTALRRSEVADRHRPGLEPLDRAEDPRRGAGRAAAGANRAGRGRHPQRDRDPGAARVPPSTSPGRISLKGRRTFAKGDFERADDSYRLARHDVRGDGSRGRAGGVPSRRARRSPGSRRSIPRRLV